MKLLILSDLHLEFHADCGECFLRDTPWPEHDVVVIAGDVSNSKKLIPALENIHTTFGDRPIVYVSGNHECYHSSLLKVEGRIAEACRSGRFPNLHWLSNNYTTIENQRFIGGTMWTPKSVDRVAKEFMNDFKCIQHFEQVYADHKDFMENILPFIEPDDVVVTHHLPSFKSVPRQFTGSSLNQFFVNDVEHVIDKLQPKLWVHGHTHSLFDYNIGPTRVVANPFGYPGENPGFLENFVVEI
jgi:Icc-related predicted phosphoesterase